MRSCVEFLSAEFQRTSIKICYFYIMKKFVTFAVLFVFFVSCKQKISKDDIQKMNGYWEIEKVVFPEGEPKDFPINMTYDYIELKNDKGFRRKGAPRFDGKFEANDILEEMEIIFKDDRVFVNYSTEFAKWQEELEKISDEKMVLLNNENKEYHYKRTAPLNFTDDGKKIK